MHCMSDILNTQMADLKISIKVLVLISAYKNKSYSGPGENKLCIIS